MYEGEWEPIQIQLTLVWYTAACLCMLPAPIMSPDLWMEKLRLREF